MRPGSVQSSGGRKQKKRAFSPPESQTNLIFGTAKILRGGKPPPRYRKSQPSALPEQLHRVSVTRRGTLTRGALGFAALGFRAVARLRSTGTLILAGVIGHIPTRTFEVESTHGDELANFPLAMAAFSDRGIRDSLHRFSRLPTLQTFILIDWHL
jgi:hypothetical protein